MKKLFVSIAIVSLTAFFFSAATVNAQNTDTKVVTGSAVEKSTDTKMCCKDPSKPCTGPCKDKKDCKGGGKCSHGKTDGKDVKGGGCSSACKGSGTTGNTKEAKMCIANNKVACTNCNPSCKGYTKTETKSCCPKSKETGCPKAAGSGCSQGKGKGKGSGCPHSKSK